MTANASIPFESITSETTLNDVIAAQPEATTVFAARDLDTCCGGGATLAEACADAGVSLDDLMADLGRLWDRT
ncbi:MAG: DUF542 domain-containing protein [Trueperaceae bacterium]|nr:DUF542 domain-containing protein [Trueperaceae bacterium]